MGVNGRERSNSCENWQRALPKQRAKCAESALRFARGQERLSKKGGDSASADAWNRVAKAIALIELESIRLMLDRGPGRS